MASHAPQFGLALLALVVCAGCNLPAIPLDPEPDAGAEDASTNIPVEPPPGSVCIPGERFCAGSDRPDVIVACAPDGSRIEEVSCGSSKICRVGVGDCFSISDLCEPGDVFRLSTKDVFFDVDPDGKSSGALVSLTNCTRAPITIRTLRLLTPRDSAGEPVFSLEPGDAFIQGLRIDGGASQDLRLKMTPRNVGWQEVGELLVDAESAALGVSTQRARLTTSSWCLGAPPIVDLGEVVVGEPVTFDIPLHNCGSRSLFVSGINVTSAFETDEESYRVEFDGTTSLPARIARSARVTLERGVPGRIDASVELVLPPQQRDLLGTSAPPIRVQGFAVHETDCDDSVEAPLASPEGRLGDLLENAASDLFSLLALPEGFPDGWSARWSVPGFDVFQYEDRLAFVMPSRVGEFPVELDLVSPSGARGCSRGEYALEVLPVGPIHIELSWAAPESEDPIPNDYGPGKGVDLDIHLLDPAEGCWSDHRADCWDDASLRRSGLCASGARMVNRSQTGSLSEVVTSDGLAPVSFGVYVKNLGQFSQAEAIVRAWWLGAPLHPDGGWRQTLAQSDKFWRIGDVDAGRFEARGGTFNGFPFCD